MLKQLDLRIPAKTSMAIVGESGAGKSTMVQLLLRFFDVTTGAVLIEGTDIREMKLRPHWIQSRNSRFSRR